MGIPFDRGGNQGREHNLPNVMQLAQRAEFEPSKSGPSMCALHDSIPATWHRATHTLFPRTAAGTEAMPCHCRTEVSEHMRERERERGGLTVFFC